MNINPVNIVVKVGKGSKSTFRNVRAHRALTFNDIQNIIDKNNDTNVIVVESVYDSESITAYDTVKQLKESGKLVIFYPQQEDKNINVISKALGIYTAKSIEEVHSKVKQFTGINVSTQVLTIKKEDSAEGIRENEESNTTENSKTEINIIQDDKLINDIENLVNNTESENIESEETLNKGVPELVAILNTLNSEKDVLEGKLKEASDRIEILLSVKESLEDERDMYKEMLESIEKGDDIIEDPVKVEEYNKVLAENTKVLEEKNSLELQVIALEEKIETLKNELNLSETNGKVNKELENQLHLEQESRLLLNDILSDSIDIGTSLANDIENKNIELEELRAEAKKLENSKGTIEVEFQQLKNNYDYLSSCQDNLQLKMDNENNQLQLDLKLANEKRDYFERELDSIRNLLAEKEKALAIALSNENYNKAEKLMEKSRVLEESNSILINNLNLIRVEQEELKKKLAISERANNNLEETNKQLRTSVLALSRGASIAGGSKLELECNYNAKGIIIPVYGSGSYGVTTTAISIARRLMNKRVVYVDLDIVNPKADSWFGVNPLIRELSGIRNEMYKTGVGALIEKGYDYVIGNEKLIFQRVADNKNGFIDYMGGIYASVDIAKLMAVKFTEFMNYLGNCYDYVILDLGRLGSSDVSNAIIKMADTISYTSVAVTLKDNIDVRNTSIKARDLNLDMKKTVWILNMADNTTIDKLTTKSVGEAKILIMPKSMKMYGSKKSYDKVLELKDKLNELVEMIIN